LLTQDWCARIAEDGWQLRDADIGAVIDHEGREVRSLSVRRKLSPNPGRSVNVKTLPRRPPS
jgi:hypothetical protein